MKCLPKFPALSIGLALLGLLAACVPPGVVSKKNTMQATEIAPVPTSSAQFAGYSCSQLAGEVASARTIINEMSGKLERGDYDQSGSVTILPGMLLYDNTMARDQTYQKAQELAQIKGRLSALQEASVKTRCAPV